MQPSPQGSPLSLAAWHVPLHRPLEPHSSNPVHGWPICVSGRQTGSSTLLSQYSPSSSKQKGSASSLPNVLLEQSSPARQVEKQGSSTSACGISLHTPTGGSTDESLMRHVVAPWERSQS